MASGDLQSFLQIISEFVLGNGGKCALCKNKYQGKLWQQPPPSLVCPKKVQVNSWIQRHGREQMRGRGSKVCRGPHAYRGAGVDAQPQQCSLDAEGLPSWGRAGSGLLSWITDRGDHQPSHSYRSLPAGLPWPPAHMVCSPLQPLGHQQLGWDQAQQEQKKVKPRDSWRDTERPMGYVLSLGSLFFSLCFVTVQFLSPQQRTSTINIADRGEIRGIHIPTHPSRKQSTSSDPSFFSIILDDNLGWYRGKMKGNEKRLQKTPSLFQNLTER